MMLRKHAHWSYRNCYLGFESYLGDTMSPGCPSGNNPADSDEIESILPTKVSAFCFFSLIHTSCYFLSQTLKSVAITGFRNSDITFDNTKRHWIKTSLASRVSRVRAPDGVPIAKRVPTGTLSDCRQRPVFSN